MAFTESELRYGLSLQANGSKSINAMRHDDDGVLELDVESAEDRITMYLSRQKAERLRDYLNAIYPTSEAL